MTLQKPFPILYDGAEYGLGVEMGNLFFDEARPSGITIHYTASPSAESAVQYLRTTNKRYHLVIDRDGYTHQIVYLNQTVNHAGKALWEGLAPNTTHVAVALVSWGELTLQNGSYTTWSGNKIKDSEVRVIKEENKLSFWHKCTKEQINALISFCMFCCKLGIEPKDICGHHECCIPPGRKRDPGYIFPFTMDEFRDLIDRHIKILS